MKNSKQGKYITIDGTDFRTIASELTARGHQMNHATARNITITSIRKLMSNIAARAGTEVTKDLADSLMTRQDVHDMVGDCLYKCAQDLGVPTTSASTEQSQ